jgi:hypothetical protein
MKETWEKYLSIIDEDWPRSRELPIEDLLLAKKWCEENCVGEWNAFAKRIYIKESKDAVLFLLRWG